MEIPSWNIDSYQKIAQDRQAAMLKVQKKVQKEGMMTSDLEDTPDEQFALPSNGKKESKPLPHYDTTRAIAEPFESYFEKHLPTIKEIQEHMQTKLSEFPNILVEQLKDCEKFNVTARAMLAFANSYLDLAERQRLVPYDRGSYTDTDRSIELAAACARERRFRDVVEGLIEGIDRRISLGQSLLKYYENLLRQGA